MSLLLLLLQEEKLLVVSELLASGRTCHLPFISMYFFLTAQTASFVATFVDLNLCKLRA